MTDANGQLPPEEAEAARAALAAQSEVIAQVLAVHMPSLAGDLDKLSRFCVGLLMEQQTMFDVVLSAADPNSQMKNPWWGFVVTDKNGSEMRVKCPKAMDEVVKTPQHLFNFVTIIGLLLNPVARGFLGTNGLTLQFFECQPERPVSKLIQA